MRPWVSGGILVACLVSPIAASWWRRRRPARDVPWIVRRLMSPTLQRRLFEGRGRYVGYALEGVCCTALIFFFAWTLTQPHRRGRDQMTSPVSWPAEIVYSVAGFAVFWIMFWLIGEQEQEERRRRDADASRSVSEADRTDDAPPPPSPPPR